MTRFQRIRIGGFRRLYDLDLEMRPLMVLIGANGVGKTSFLDAIKVLSASADGRLNQTLNDMGGMTGILTNNTANKLVFDFFVKSGRIHANYGFEIIPTNLSYSFSKEFFNETAPRKFTYIDRSSYVITTNEYDLKKILKSETVLSQLPALNKTPENIRDTLRFLIHYHSLSVDTSAPFRLPQQLRPADLPGENGEYIIPYLYSLKESHPDRFESLEDTLKAAYPGFQRLGFPPVAAGMLAMTWKDKNFTTPLYMNQLSEGTLRFLWLASLFHSPALPSITMIDEPEVSLHPELLAHLVELMREASQRTQLIVATHSDRLVRFLKPEEVVTMDMDERGFATAAWADTFDLDEWLKEYTLDEVWSMGRMGGRAL